MNKLQKGFTLIELLVVIAIIGMLSSIILVSLNSARAKARDAKRFAELHQFQIALNLYYQTNGSYPIETCGGPETVAGQADIQGWAGDYSGDTTYTACQTDLQTKLSSYISKLPLDPMNSGSDTEGYRYWYGSVKNGQGYLLLARPEVSSNRGNKCYYPNSGWYCIGENWQ